MDTHINEADLAHARIGLSSPIGLPGEDTGGLPPEASENDDATAFAGVPPASPGVPASPKRRSKRGKLLAGAAIVVVLGGASAGAYVFRDKIAPIVSPYTARGQQIAHSLGAKAQATVGPYVDRAVATTLTWFANSHQAPPAASPASQVTTAAAQPAPVPAAARPATPPTPPTVAAATVAEPGLAAPVRAVPTASTAPANPSESRAELAEFAALKPSASLSDETRSNPAPAEISTRPDLVPSSDVTPPSNSKPAAARVEFPEPALAMASPMPSASLAPSVPQPSSAAQAAPTTPPVAAVPLPATLPRDVISTAIELQASPMTPPQQIAVLGLVKDMAAQLRDTRLELAQMHQALSHLATQVETKTSDFDARLSMTEAAAMVHASARAGAPPAPAEEPAPAPFTANPIPAAAASRSGAPRGSAPAAATPATATILPDRRTVKDYVLKGASPGLAVLASLNPVPGSAAVIEVGVGDPVPGLGRIKRVYQRGATWIVDTDGGSIQ